MNQKITLKKKIEKRNNMYTSEIKELVKLRNNLLEVREYIDIIDNSPQIDHIIYEQEYFNIFSNDGLDIKIKIKEIQ